MRMGIKVFLIEPIAQQRVWLRRYTFSNENECPGKKWGHDASQLIGDFDSPVAPLDGDETSVFDKPPITDLRWPVKCDTCPYQFAPANEWQVFHERLCKAADGRIFTRRDNEIGIMFWSPWFHSHGHELHCMYWDNCKDPRGHLICKLPGPHDWDIMSRAANCTMPEDKLHRCWILHGDPSKGETVHVDKDGLTCQAGAGSIALPNWHGFLHGGELVGA